MDRVETEGTVRQGTRRAADGARGIEREAGRAARDPRRARRDAEDAGRRLERNAEHHPRATAAGAATGAVGGAMMGGPVGAVVGAVLGAARGLIAADAVDAARHRLRGGGRPGARDTRLGNPARRPVPDRSRVIAAAGGDADLAASIDRAGGRGPLQG